MYIKKRVVCIISILILLFSCNFENQSTQKVVCKIIEENPPTISWSSSEELEVRSVEADVTVYSINNKKSNETKIARQFRVTQKMIQEELYSRMDFALDMQGKKRSLISNEDETVVVNSENESIEYRIKNQSVPKDLLFLGTNKIMGRINLNDIRKESKRLSLDVIEDNESNLVIALPNRLVESLQLKNRISTKIMYDVANETLSQIETIDVLEDGTKVTTTVYEMYEESEGEMIKIGSVTVVNSEAATLLPGFEDVEYFESIEEIPEISETEYEELVEKGSVEVIEDMNFGNPADMSYEEVIVEMYSNIEINSVEDASFRILLSE